MREAEKIYDKRETSEEREERLRKFQEERRQVETRTGRERRKTRQKA